MNPNGFLLFLAVAVATGIGLTVATWRGKAQLRAALNRLDLVAFLANAPIGVLRLDSRGRILYANRKARQILDVRNKVIEGFHFADVLDSAVGATIARAIEEAGEGTNVAPQRTTGPAPPLQHYAADSGPVVAFRKRYFGRSGYVVLFPPAPHSVISAPDDIAKCGEHVIQRFVHDVKNSLMVVESDLKAVERELARLDCCSSKAGDALARIRQRTHRIAGVARRFQKLAMAGLEERAEIRLREEVPAWLPNWSQKVPGDIQLSAELEGEPGLVGDPELVEMLLESMVRYGVRHMLRGGRLFLRFGEKFDYEKLGRCVAISLHCETPDSSPDGLSPNRDLVEADLAVIRRIVHLHEGQVEVTPMVTPSGMRLLQVFLPAGLQTSAAS